MTYRVSDHKHETNSSLVDRGVNGGIVGNDVYHIATCSDKPINIMVIDNHQLWLIHLVSTGGGFQFQIGPVILIFHQYAHYGKGKLTHSPVQFEVFKKRLMIYLSNLETTKPLKHMMDMFFLWTSLMSYRTYIWYYSQILNETNFHTYSWPRIPTVILNFMIIILVIQPRGVILLLMKVHPWQTQTLIKMVSICIEQ